MLTDYDGTLAPFRKERDRAVPYPGVEDALDRLARYRTSRVVVVTGRSAADIPKLMPLAARLEVWGSHGLERRAPDGTYRLAGRTKGMVVDAIFGEMGEDAAVAYLGDDATDEDAFRAILGRGLGVLVRPEPRQTAASAHLTPPEQQLDFLDRWTACSRAEP